jgi:hypothetical protein
MKTRLIKDLGNMNPGELEPKAWKGGDTSFTNDVIDALPEKESMKARIAVFEAIVDEVVEDTIDEKEVESDAPVTENEVEEVVEPIVDKAVALGIVPSSVRRKVSNLVHAKLISRKTRASLLAKAAHMVAEAVTETDYNAGADNIDTPIDETVNINQEIKDATSEKDEAPNEGTAPTTSAWLKAWDNNGRRSRFEGDVGVDDGDDLDEVDAAVGAPEGGPANDISVDVDDGLDTETKANMRYLVKSAIHHRRATAKVSRRLSAQLTDNMMYQLRYALPAKFYNKYRG